MTAQPNADATHPLIGTTVGKYRITRLVGLGGMGAVFEAQHESINQRVAIKVMHQKLLADPASVQRFIKEAKTTSLVQHVGLVRVFDFGQLDNGGAAFMMMEFLEGESLKARLAKVQKLSVVDSLRLTRQIAAAVAAAHERGIVHRDLKPENIILVPDPETPSGERAKVLDFGIAKVLEPEEGEVLKTTTGAIIGTPTYMSPEQCRGVGDVTEKSDVYSLGAVLYQMLSGRPPFEGKGAGDLIAMHIVEKPQMLRSFAPNVSTEVETLVHQMLEKKPADRPSMRQVLTGLEQLGHSSTASGLTGQVIVVPPPELPPPPPAKKNTAVLAIGGLLVVAIGVGVVAVTQRVPVPVPTNVPVAQPPVPQPKLPEPPLGPNASIVVESEPLGAQVLAVPDGKPLGTTPWRLQRDRQAGKLEVVVRQAGYADQKLVFDGQSDDTRLVKLVASSPQSPAANPTSAEIAKKNALVRKPLVQPQKPGKPLGKPAEKNRDDDIDIAIKR